jgi:hypothetical protein
MRALLLNVCLVLAAASSVLAQTTVINFDGPNPPGGDCVDAAAYLASYGITFVPISSGATSIICDTAGTAAVPASPPNVFYTVPPVTNTDVSYELRFSTPLTQFAFTRAAIDPVTAIPPWSAFAYDAAGTLLSSIAEPLRYPGPPAAVFTMPGPGITRVRINAFNSAHVTFNHPPFDNMILTTPHPVCSYSFSGGNGAGAVRYCLTDRGNVVQFTSPLGQEHIGVGSQVWEGYVVCTGSSPQVWDLGSSQEGFGEPIQLSAPTATGVVIRRLSPQYQLDQTFKLDKVAKAVTVTMTLTNISGGPISDARLTRAYDPDLNGDAGDFETKSARSVWASDVDALALTAITWATPSDTTIDGSTIPGCSGAGAAPPVLTGDGSIASVTYRLGDLPAGAKRRVVFVYRLQ